MLMNAEMSFVVTVVLLIVGLFYLIHRIVEFIASIITFIESCIVKVALGMFFLLKKAFRPLLMGLLKSIVLMAIWYLRSGDLMIITNPAALILAILLGAFLSTNV